MYKNDYILRLIEEFAKVMGVAMGFRAKGDYDEAEQALTDALKKFGDTEIAQIYEVLDGKKSQVAFFHSFNGKQRQIWINKSADGECAFFKIKEMNKSISGGEATVMKLLIAHIVVRMNLE